MNKDTKFKNGHIPWNKDSKGKVTAWNKGKNLNGQGRWSTNYHNWRNAVFTRDENKCIKCKSTYRLHAHHIIPWKEDKTKRFDVDNGLTLCHSCHMREEKTGFCHSDETKKKISEAHKGKLPWNKGVPQSEEVKNKLRKSLKGRTPWNKGIKGIKSPMKGKKHTEESKNKMSKSRIGKPAPWNSKPMSEETKIKISESKKGQVPPNKGKRKQYPNAIICKSCEIEKSLEDFPKKKHWYESTCRACRNKMKRDRS